jgi:hypothetical protein
MTLRVQMPAPLRPRSPPRDNREREERLVRTP